MRDARIIFIFLCEGKDFERLAALGLIVLNVDQFSAHFHAPLGLVEGAVTGVAVPCRDGAAIGQGDDVRDISDVVAELDVGDGCHFFMWC